MPRTKKATETATDTPLSAAENINYVAPTTDFPFVYANNAMMQMNELDSSLIFGEVVGNDGVKTLVIPKVKVVMTTPFLYKLRDLLVTNLGAEGVKTIKKAS